MTELLEFIDFVDAINAVREELDDRQWRIGDVAAQFERKIGRPRADGDDTPQLGDLAAACGLSKQSLSAYAKTAEFYQENLRTSVDLSWSLFDLARRHAGDDVEVAMDYLTIAQEQAFSYRQFERYLKGIWWEGEVYERELPQRLHGILPTGVIKVWVTIEKVRE